MRTQEQAAADEALTQAIEDVMRAYDFRQPDTVNINYIVLVEQRVFGKDVAGDDDSSGIVTIFKDGGAPWVSILGIMRAATLRLEAEYAEGTRSDRE